MNINHVSKVMSSLINGGVIRLNDSTSLEYIQLCEKTVFNTNCVDLMNQQDGLYAKLILNGEVYYHYLGPSERYYILAVYATNDVFLRGIIEPIFKLDAQVTTKNQLVKLTNFFNSISKYKVTYNQEKDMLFDDNKPLFDDHKANYIASKNVQKIFLLQLIYQITNYAKLELDSDWLNYDAKSTITIFRNKELVLVETAPVFAFLEHPVVKASDRFSLQHALSHYGKTIETL